MKNFAVFCGGYSSEFDISVKSAENVIKCFPDEFQVFKVIVSKSGWKVEYKQTLFDYNFKNPGFKFEKININFDFALVYIHGDPGENGKIQAYLELVCIPFVNCNLIASSLTFDKWYCNNFLNAFEIPVAQNLILSTHDKIEINEIIQKLGLPLFVKPTDAGSSFGVSKVKKAEELMPAVKSALKEGKWAMLESFLEGREVTCAVYRNNEGIQTLPITEIVSENEFFDFDAKYNGKSLEITPARINKEEELSVINVSKKIYELLQLKSFVRIDFIIVGTIPYLVEVNTIPGFSNESIVPKMLECAQIDRKEFLRKIINFELNL